MAHYTVHFQGTSTLGLWGNSMDDLPIPQVNTLVSENGKYYRISAVVVEEGAYHVFCKLASPAEQRKLSQARNTFHKGR